MGCLYLYLKRLEMRGFKSFADKTHIDFDNGVTCIVGPNGSGKSNITDAVRWVLGEQKIKTLRGTKMEDIIFNGTQHRKKLGMAEVSLAFDNSEGFFSLDFNEVKVCRRVYRSGESEYLLNDVNCRLKDIRDLFMDTGIGTDGYSIIGQGRIERVLSNNLDERRLLFEEAAGIVKYKTRKRETERKLDNTELNLVRVEDIFSELASRVEPLKIESEKAKRHIELSERLSELEMNLFINDIESVDKKIAKEVENIDGTVKELEIINKSKEQFYIEKNKFSSKIELSNNELQNIKNSFFEDKNEIANIDGEVNVLNARIESNTENQSRLKEELQKNEVHLKEIEKNIQNTISKKMTIEEQLVEIGAMTNSTNANFESVSKALYNGEVESDRTRDVVLKKLNEIERNKNEINSYNAISENHITRKQELVNEIKENEYILKDEMSKDTDHENQLIGLLDTEQMLIKESEVLRFSLNETDQILKRDGIVINDFRKKFTEFSTESALLNQMEKEFSGFDHSVKKALQLSDENHDLKGINGVVASLMNIPKKYEVALEVALGKSIQNIVTETPDDAKAVIQELKRTKSGRVTFIPLSGIVSKGDQTHVLEALTDIDGYIGKANDLFEYDEKYKILYDYLVGRTVIVSDVEAATKALKIKNLKYKVVTLEGDVFIPGGTITGGSYKSKSSGILSRKRKIIELDAKIDETNESIEVLSESINEFRDKQKSLSYDLEQNSKISESIRLEIVKKENDIKIVKDQMERLSMLISKRKSESIIIENDIQSVDEAVKKRSENMVNLNLEVKELELKVNKDSSDLDALKSQMQNLRDELTEVRIKNASLLEGHKSVETEVVRLLSEKEEAIKKNSINSDLVDEILLQLNQLRESIGNLKKKKELVLVTSNDKNDKIKIIQNEIVLLESKINEINSNNRQLFENIENLKETLHKFEIKKAKFDVHREEIALRLFERYEISPYEAVKLKKDIDMDNANKEIRVIKSELKQIGDVSIGSIEEYEEVSERYIFLKTQHDDLVEARNSLKKLIRELEKVMKERFLECFDTVKVHFSEIFSNLFVGGKAELTILDIHNVLESDIGIDIQPPGKKLQNISLLSGGEKALTAIALLFAILKTKPAPFCILDEIEAALDDVNVYRFADFLKEFTRNSQFVIITHRKGTMEIADNLFGITMQEFGISKMISVKLEDAILE